MRSPLVNVHGTSGQRDRVSDHLLGGVEAVEDAAIFDDPAVTEFQELGLVVADDAAAADQHAGQPAEGRGAVALDQHRVELDLA